MSDFSSFFGTSFDSGEPTADTSASWVENAALGGGILSVGGALISAIGTYYESRAQKYALQSQQLSAEFAQTMARLEGRAAERDASEEMQAGEYQVLLRGLQASQEKGAAAVSAGARGVSGGGEAALRASIELARRLDARSINIGAVRAANAARTRGVNARTRAAFAGLTAINARNAARSINPGLNAGVQLGTGLGSLLSRAGAASGG